eukprot:10829631-Lingulodinium_polyedra.AAC.1
MYEQNLPAPSASRKVRVDALLRVVEELVRRQLETDRRLVTGRCRPRTSAGTRLWARQRRLALAADPGPGLG